MVVSLMTPSEPWVWFSGGRLWHRLGVGFAGLFAQIFLTWSFRRLGTHRFQLGPQPDALGHPDRDGIFVVLSLRNGSATD